MTDGPLAYLIGGAPRVGKSTLARELTRHHPLQCASTDDIRTHLRAQTTPAAEPDLFYLDSLNVDEAEMARRMREDTDAILDAASRESAVVWRTVEAFIHDNLVAGHDVVVEGVAVQPAFVSTLDLPYRVVYLGNQSATLATTIAAYARLHPDSWLGGLQPDTLSAYAHYARAFSARIEAAAHRYDQPYLEMTRQSFEQGLAKATHLLV